jgi:hypothetical protein
MSAFECKQDTDSDNLTGMQFGLWHLLFLSQLVIDSTEYLDDNLFGSHDLAQL